MPATAGGTGRRRRPWGAQTPLRTFCTALQQAPVTARRQLMYQRQQRLPDRGKAVAPASSTGDVLHPPSGGAVHSETAVMYINNVRQLLISIAERTTNV